MRARAARPRPLPRVDHHRPRKPPRRYDLRRPSVVLDTKSVVLPGHLENDSRGGGIVHEPTGAWMMQVVRNRLDSEEGFLTGKSKLIMDRDPVFTADVRALLRSGGVETVRLPARSPNLNAYAERFVLSIKSECLDRLVLLGAGHLRFAVREYVAHYNLERPHQGLGETVAVTRESQPAQVATFLELLQRFDTLSLL